MNHRSEDIIMNKMDIEYMNRGLELTANIGKIMQDNLEDLQGSVERMKQPAVMIDQCTTLQDFLEVSCHDENYDYNTRYGEKQDLRYRISRDDMSEIDNRLVQLHNGTEKILFKIRGIENFIQSKM